MKIGIVSIGNDSLELFRFLHRYDHEYVVYYDADSWPLGDKTRDRQLEIVQQGYDCLVAEGCERVIVPPIGEIGSERRGKEVKGGERILPLYRSYVMHAFSQSLVGKIGYVHEPGHIQRKGKEVKGSERRGKESINMFQQGLEQWASEYQRSEAQLATKQFHRPMVRWGRDVRQWKYFLRSLSPRNYLINKVVKFDLRKLKDSDVDTVLLTEWSHLAMEKTIERFFNQRRTKWHGTKILEEIFVKHGETGGNIVKGGYSVTVLYRGDIGMLESAQKYPRLMARGREIEILFRSLYEE